MLCKAGFVYLFRNARWSDHQVDHAALARHLAARARGNDFRILMFTIPRRAADAGRWIYGRRRFQRADVLIVKADGSVELRLIAVHPVSGLVGTKTKYLFHHRLTKLAARCQSHLAGSIDLFPAQDRAASVTNFSVPAGPANLDLGRPAARVTD